MKYISTRGGDEPIAFREAVLMGLARDGGLLLPSEYPSVKNKLSDWSRLSYPELACEVIGLFADDIPPAELKRIATESYSAFAAPDVAPVRPLGDMFLLELFHGPTLAFKDFALQFLGRLFEYLLRESGGELNLLAATSGDTGSAAIHGMRGRDRLRIFVLHPKGRVSPAQEMQMTTVTDANVFNLAVEGTFDDCQNIVKALFNDLTFRDTYRLGAVNSINWARVLAQTVYYFHAAFRVMERTGSGKVQFSVPTGNFGDVFAGYVAWRMGLPIERLIVATNENDILARFFTTGEYRTGAVAHTLSPSMDIQVASNFERYLFHREGDDPGRVRSLMDDFANSGALKVGVAEEGVADRLFRAGASDTAETLATIREYHRRHGVVLDPHTAVGVATAEKERAADIPTICLATAHPAKFPEAIKQALGEDGHASHESLSRLANLPRRVFDSGADAAEIGDFLRARIPTD